MTRRAFDPEQPIDRPVRAGAELLGAGVWASGVWDLAQLRSFEHAAARGMDLGTPFAAAVRADALLRAPQVIDSLEASGCEELHVDFDSLGPADDPRAEQLTELVEALRARGLRIHGAFTLGQDHDDAGSFERLVEWVEARRLASVSLRLWTPDPGSALVRELARADRVRHRDLRRWDGAHVVVAPANMSAQTLYRGWVWARRQLSSITSIWRRRPTTLAELPGYLWASVCATLAPSTACARARARLLPARGASFDSNPRGSGLVFLR
ncbi:hypothetical protein ENSA5_40470 [Enhygromyxa salina]|uniref:DUF4070 domain-containing protein n=1 Tax=Enhygromyxa salina TaxID=215803 RepID=A0A2S9XPC7_9BACT|nr:hypothetical protein [Enhygromyxa salina]PRP94724.1 hypothetical protein ENSA5_40470 [Enhygromyxa salina]